MTAFDRWLAAEPDPDHRFHEYATATCAGCGDTFETPFLLDGRCQPCWEAANPTPPEPWTCVSCEAPLTETADCTNPECIWYPPTPSGGSS